MIDWNRVTELIEEVGRESFDDVLTLFLEEVEDVTARLASKPDLQALEHDMHFLKSSALTLGFSDFAARCQTAEIDAARGFGDHVELSDILECYLHSKAHFLEELPHRLAA
ncbi:MAG: Hpt domain-containing protein [Pseudomonadota bacterium]